jgi:flagellum-specific peptidoglycan hydrolase FlgJ
MKKENSQTESESEIDWSIIRRSEFKDLLPYIIAQAKHETGNFSSRLSREANNIFGMRKVYKRKNFQIGTTKGEGGADFGVYATKDDAVRDFLEWLRQWKTKPFPRRVSSAAAYASELKQRGYFSDDLANYKEGILRWMTI